MSPAAFQKMKARRSGFSLVELMIVVTLIGLLSSMAIPTYMRFQLKAKSSEAKVNLAAIHTAEEAYFSEFGVYVPAIASPTVTPGTTRTQFDLIPGGFGSLGWRPEGTVYFTYAVAVSPDGTGFTADAGADIDGDSNLQYWGIVRSDTAGARTAGAIGCDIHAIRERQVAPCTPQSGQSVF